MPAVGKTDEPQALKPYRSHGLDVQWNGNGQGKADCPFCGTEGKWFVNVENGLWQCKVCGSGSEKGGGNVLTFLRLLHSHSGASGTDYAELMASRGILREDTLERWGVVKSSLTGEWCVPGYSAAGTITQLYRYATMGNRRALLCTPGTDHALHGVNLYDPKKPDVYLCEGPWDAMVLWETLRAAKNTEDGLKLTAAEEGSLLSRCNVLAAPGCAVFSESWCTLFAGKRVFILYDSDHPKTKGAITTSPAGWEGAKRAAKILAASEHPPAEIHVLSWGEGGFDPQKKSGYDVRDYLAGVGFDMRTRLTWLSPLLAMVKPIPPDWIPGRTRDAAKTGSTEISCTPCSSWRELTNQWRKGLKWTDGLEGALSVMLACAASTELPKDQLWVKIISPPSGGKSTLCEALSVCKKHVRANSGMTGFASGFQTDADASEDHSEMKKLKGKTLVTKDGDTLMQSVNKDKILSEARDLYDKCFRPSFRNKSSREYENHNITWILCGTASLHGLDGSELGERFVDYVIMDKVDESLEREIARRNVNALRSAFANLSSVTNGDSPDTLKCKQMTGGYVEYLRANANRLIEKVEMTDEAVETVCDYADWVAFMRTRPSKVQTEVVQREMSARLSVQLTKLAYCTAIVTQRPSIDAKVLNLVRKCALDTGRGKTTKLGSYLWACREDGAEVKSLSVWTAETENETRKLLRFLQKIEAVDTFKYQLYDDGGLPVGGSRVRWRLTPRLLKLFDAVRPELPMIKKEH